MITLNAIEALDRWLDESDLPEPYKSQPSMIHQARIMKVIEELGEACQAWIGATGQNPRKGITCTMDDVLSEMADVVVTAYCCIQHFTKDKYETHAIVNRRLDYLLHRIGLSPQHDLPGAM